MPEITLNAVPCCFTDISTGRIRWKWRQGHWVIAGKPASTPTQERYNTNRHG
ncbi:hypothetical protein ILT44_28435 [Microvirga sp. BT689]|uniref:hypothetical protein n=1 Tax=Microvirga arvi TaxID=2778731 RepID=UPI001951B779|nr:hypothetical protein [Microvirga arvi]MBM6584129.1 hypothetical protein [Microvirga arvi]